MTIQKIRNEARFFGEVFVDGLGYLKEDLRRTWRIVRGTEPARGDGCNLAECEHDSIGTFPHPESYRDEMDVCRKHWLTLHAGIKAATLVIYGLLFGVPLLVLLMVMP